uniref:protein XPH1 n=1 Tax=Xylella fastidiosa subsp. sandyi Ann-1 TaxID=155920 RepID=UPI000DCF63D3|nr:Chain A, protein XPH1 [Xylella fastidiosa subsp. sandyi Ann-1]
MNAIDIAINKLGSVSALAAALGVNQSAISQWRARGRVPAGRCIDIELYTDGRVECRELRPDVFGALEHHHHHH